MGVKKVKAIVADLDKMPTFHDRKKLMGAVREYGALLSKDPAIDMFRRVGTAMMGDFTNRIGGLPYTPSMSMLMANVNTETKISGYKIRDTQSLSVAEAGRAEQGEIATGLLYVEADAPDLHAALNTSLTPLNELDERALCPGAAKAFSRTAMASSVRSLDKYRSPSR